MGKNGAKTEEGEMRRKPPETMGTTAVAGARVAGSTEVVEERGWRLFRRERNIFFYDDDAFFLYGFCYGFFS